MPELPEVETIVRTLERNLQDEIVQKIDLRYPKFLESSSKYPMSALNNQKFVGFRRIGKYLIFDFSNGLSWIVHLRMEGKFYLYDEPTKPTIHTHLIINTNKTEIHYLDVRKFSTFAVVDDVDAYFGKKGMGPEPWDLSVEDLHTNLSKTRRHIKTVLLDQKIVSGIGNIYADEILFETQIHPLTAANKLILEDVAHLVPTMKRVLEHAIEAGGTTIRSYTSSLNVHGRFQLELKAYGKEGQPCSRCSTIMQRIVVNGRSSVYCPQCQKELV